MAKDVIQFFQVLTEDFSRDPNNVHILYVNSEGIKLTIHIKDESRADLVFRLIRYFLYD